MDSQLIYLLLNLVFTEGAHIKYEVTKNWNAVNDHFFNQNESMKAELYLKDDPRKLRDKCKADIERGNLSGNSRDLDQQYQLMKQILMGIVDDEEGSYWESSKGCDKESTEWYRV